MRNLNSYPDRSCTAASSAGLPRAPTDSAPISLPLLIHRGDLSINYVNDTIDISINDVNDTPGKVRREERAFAETARPDSDRPASDRGPLGPTTRTGPQAREALSSLSSRHSRIIVPPVIVPPAGAANRPVCTNHNCLGRCGLPALPAGRSESSIGFRKLPDIKELSLIWGELPFPDLQPLPLFINDKYG
jgi:hypothetical protein